MDTYQPSTIVRNIQLQNKRNIGRLSTEHFKRLAFQFCWLYFLIAAVSILKTTLFLETIRLQTRNYHIINQLVIGNKKFTQTFFFQLRRIGFVFSFGCKMKRTNFSRKLRKIFDFFVKRQQIFTLILANNFNRRTSGSYRNRNCSR